jgi:hypothetical protein
MHPTYASGRRQHLTNKTGRKPCPTDKTGRKPCPTDKTGRKPCPTNKTGRKLCPTNKTGRKPCPTNKTGRKPRKQTLVKNDDRYTVKCKHCDTVRSVNKAPAVLNCKGGCKKNYVHDLELGSNKHWEVIAEADDRDKQQENVIESDDGDGNFEFEMDISSLCLLLSRHTKDPLHQVLSSVPVGSLHPFFHKPHAFFC